MANILIIGCGYVGQALAQDYVKNGHKVYALQRHPVSLPGVENILADITDLNDKAMPKVDTAFYLVAPNSHDEAAYQNAYVNGLKNSLNLLKHQSCQFIFASSTAVYGQTNGEWVDENSETIPPEFSGKILLQAENALKQCGIQHKVVRFGGIYGPGRTHLIRQVLEQKAQQTPYPVYTNRIHLNDCAGVLAHVAAIKNESHHLYLGVDNTPALYNEVLQWIAQQLRLPLPPVGKDVPPRLAKSHKRCQNQRLRTSGYLMKMSSYREGYQDLIEQINHQNN
jgi:nucleoside-diphosphate-sugar epimerase